VSWKKGRWYRERIDAGRRSGWAPMDGDAQCTPSSSAVEMWWDLAWRRALERKDPFSEWDRDGAANRMLRWLADQSTEEN
jgi:hypothetical protein